MIYVHVPFCRSFCTYCDFYSEIAAEGCFKAYVDDVCAEIRARKDEMDDDPKTLYFGGGTPSVLPLSSLTRILLALEDAGHGEHCHASCRKSLTTGWITNASPTVG